VLAGKLRVERELGRGGMGVVVAATDLSLGRRVAVKLIDSELAASEQIRERLIREARAAAALRSPHAVQVFEVGIHDGLPFVVMELLVGETVEAFLVREGPLPVRRAVEWMIQALDAVSEAHGLGLVHRDIKPANLFVEASRAGTRIKVLDFGIVKSREATPLSATGEVFGTPAYMSPEQARGSDVDARADVWALGATLFEMLTGQLPFPATSTVGMVLRIIEGEPVPLRACRADVPPTLDAIVRRCFEKAPGARFADAAALAAALVALQGELVLRSNRPTAGPAPLEDRSLPPPATAPLAPTVTTPPARDPDAPATIPSGPPPAAVTDSLAFAPTVIEPPVRRPSPSTPSASPSTSSASSSTPSVSPPAASPAPARAPAPTNRTNRTPTGVWLGVICGVALLLGAPFVCRRVVLDQWRTAPESPPPPHASPPPADSMGPWLRPFEEADPWPEDPFATRSRDASVSSANSRRRVAPPARVAAGCYCRLGTTDLCEPRFWKPGACECQRDHTALCPRPEYRREAECAPFSDPLEHGKWCEGFVRVGEVWTKASGIAECGGCGNYQTHAGAIDDPCEGIDDVGKKVRGRVWCARR